jgi:multiple sugar transport system permease protein
LNSLARRMTGYVFLAPYLVLFVVFLLVPLVYGLILSFQSHEMISRDPPRFVGAANYSEALSDPYFRDALWATVKFVLMTVPATIGLAILLAAGLNALPERRANFYRLCIFLPTMITISVGGILWQWFYNNDFGIFNAILTRLGLPPVPWITSTTLAMPSIVLMTVWWTVGGPTVILLAGLKQIPDAYYEAGAIDGAVGWKRLVYITLPLLRPVLLFVLVLNVIGAWQVFGQTFVITRGGPERSTRVLVQYIYETSFNFYRMGYGAAMSWILFLIIAAFSIVQFRVLRER